MTHIFYNSVFTVLLLLLQAIQLGPTEASRYWIYWVPSQYVDAIKDTILGKWQPF